MRKRILAAMLCTALLFTTSVSADVLNYEDTLNTYKQDNKIPKSFPKDDGEGKPVTVVEKKDTVYISSKSETIRTAPGKKGKKIKNLLLGTELSRVGVCDNGWSKVVFYTNEGNLNGYIPTEALTDTGYLKKARGTLKVVKDADILDYPGRKDGEIVGEVLEMDEVERSATINGIWSRIYYETEEGRKRVGYIPTNVLEGQEKVKETRTARAETITLVDGEEAGVIHKSEGRGVFADAVDGVTATQDPKVAGVQVGTPMAVSSNAVLKPLGTFRITHYCQCSICCGPWANGITSTGVTATTNRTIAVDPTQIPYGSQVVINGQVYVAEDCGGAIKTNCIDIYVATHDEGESKGVYYTDVYLVQ